MSYQPKTLTGATRRIRQMEREIDSLHDLAAQRLTQMIQLARLADDDCRERMDSLVKWHVTQLRDNLLRNNGH